MGEALLVFLLGAWLGGVAATLAWMAPEDMYGSRWDAVMWPLAATLVLVDRITGRGE